MPEQAALIGKLASWKPFSVAVIGDLMLDEIHSGDADRLSADAPVPVLHVRKTEDRPGGAANVCLDLVALQGGPGGRVLAMGVVGDDDAGSRLRTRLEEMGVEASGVRTDPSRPTTVKRSLVGLAQHRHPQKMFRVDFESKEPIPESVRDELLERLDAALADPDAPAQVVCIEDYNKGVCTPELCQAVIERCKRAGVPVLVDPAAIADYSRYHGATCITPNRTEAEKATALLTAGEGPSPVPDRPATMARALRDTHAFESVALTLDRHGALLLEHERDPVLVPTVAREVYDVTGAGDMVLAGLAASIANGFSMLDAVRFANAAAGLEVEIFGVEPIPFERVHHAILVHEGKLRGKVRTLEQAVTEAAALRRAGRTIVFTNGCFDILHAGHVTMLDRAAEHGDALFVGLNDDDSIRRLKGATRPVNTLDDRETVLASLESVAVIVPFTQDTPLSLIEAIKPDVLVKGKDYAVDQVVGHEVVQAYGGRVELIDLVEGRSTTGTIERMKGGPSA